MGLRDIFTGMLNGPRGQRQPRSSGSGSGMRRIMMALLGLLAYKALKGPIRAAPRRRAAGSRDQIFKPVRGVRSQWRASSLKRKDVGVTDVRCSSL
jgi:hypothetical protein